MIVSLAAADLSGTWSFDFDPDFGGNRSVGEVSCTLKQDGITLSGACGADTPITGEAKGQQVRFELKTGLEKEMTANFNATVNEQGTTMSGTWRLVDAEGKTREGQFAARK
jgi:hypothetical protein